MHVGGDNAKYRRYIYSLLNVHSRLQGVRDKQRLGTKVYCDARGRPGTCDRDIMGSYVYFKQTVVLQVDNWQKWRWWQRMHREVVTVYDQVIGPGKTLQRPSFGEAANWYRGDRSVVLTRACYK